jgi:riboflavin biosynthesis pyrimidine reductase
MSKVRVSCFAISIDGYLQAGLIDEMHLAISPVLLGAGEHLLSGLDLCALGYRVAKHTSTDAARHLVVTRKARVVHGGERDDSNLPEDRQTPDRSTT